MISRYRLTDESTAVPNSDGEVVLYEDYQREVSRLRSLLDKASEDARAWKAYAARVRFLPRGNEDG